MSDPTQQTSAELGYDPRYDLCTWKGTPIPRVRDPLRATPQRLTIAGRVWWQGPPWTVLRNSTQYLWQVWDYGLDDDIDFTRQDLPIHQWHRALDAARPGLVSRSSYVLWSLVLGRITDSRQCDWPRTAHIRDCRPLSGQSREQMYRRAGEARAAHTPLLIVTPDTGTV